MRRWRPVGLSAHPRTGGEHSGRLARPLASRGSPPHGRGTPRGCAPPRRPRGLTPARAGNTRPSRWTSITLSAHPRTGGEHAMTTVKTATQMGSPPHGRGTPRAAGPRHSGDRLTPARAGNTAAPGSGRGAAGAHPRTGGEHFDRDRNRVPSSGSPPHGRGTPQRGELGRRHQGLTPARAGNTTPMATPTRVSTAHPRTGGEHQRQWQPGRVHCGSPPHGRGTPASMAARAGALRLTPARAGNTAAAADTLTVIAAHPRTGGEHNVLTLAVLMAMGSPPHGRGTPPDRLTVHQRGRLTPARAGNTTSARSATRTWTAHPRTGGEHSRSLRRQTSDRGSPPHGRGTHRLAGDGLDVGRLTPARAGNTGQQPGEAGRVWAHPRTGGEHSSMISPASSISGSPPHGRGTLQPHRWDAEGRGLTPARAGNTVRRPTPRVRPQAHPRTGGKHSINVGNVGMTEGSPPHGRGTLRCGD